MAGIYQHFRPEEKEFVDQVLSWRQFVEDTYSDKLTDFLDPRKQHILASIIGNQDVKYQFFGGTDNRERKRALIYPEYMEPQLEDFQVGLYELEYPAKFVTLDHRMILGSMMSLGLKREKFGDILLEDDRIQFFLATEIEDFVIHNFNQVAKTRVTVQKKELSQVIMSQVDWKILEKTVSSLRLDVVVSAAFNISRQKAQLAIQHGYSKVNWEIIERPAFECAEGDIISVRKQGRCSILEIQGTTKKEKIRIKLGLLK